VYRQKSKKRTKVVMDSQKTFKQFKSEQENEFQDVITMGKCLYASSNFYSAKWQKIIKMVKFDSRQKLFSQLKSFSDEYSYRDVVKSKLERCVTKIQKKWKEHKSK